MLELARIEFYDSRYWCKIGGGGGLFEGGTYFVDRQCRTLTAE